MNKEIEKYKKDLIDTYQENLEKDESEDNGNQKQMILKKNNLESEIRILKERNNNKKEMEKINNSIKDSKKHSDEINKIKISRLDLQAENKIKELNRQLQNNFDDYVKEYKIKNKNNDLNTNLFDKSISSEPKDILQNYSKKQKLN